MNIKFQDLKNKKIVITGGNGFLGKQLCKAFIDQGSKIFILDIKKPKLNKLVNFLKLILQKKRNLKIFYLF